MDPTGSIEPMGPSDPIEPMDPSEPSEPIRPLASIAPPPPPAAPVPSRPATAPERRTVTIRGRGAERDLTWTAGQARRRPSQPAHQRPGFRPDRAALWAVVLGLLLVLVAVTSSHAAVRAPHAAAARTHDGAAPVALVREIPAVRAVAVVRPRA